MKVLIIGGTGMLGHKLVQVLGENFNVSTTIRNDLSRYEKFNLFDKKRTIEKVNVENIESVERVIKKIKPNVIINAVGVIKQLPDAKNVINTLTINSIFPHRLAQIAKKYGAYLLSVSTDCVFSGLKGNYTEEDIPDAFDLYGKSKNLGEVLSKNCLTVRTSIVGRELETKHSLVEWFLQNDSKEVNGYVNAVFSGFPTVVLAKIISRLIARKDRLEGLYHFSSEPINKFDLLKLVREQYKVNIEIKPFKDFRIDRSLNSDKFRKETGFKPSGWSEMIAEMAEDPFPYNKS